MGGSQEHASGRDRARRGGSDRAPESSTRARAARRSISGSSKVSPHKHRVLRRVRGADGRRSREYSCAGPTRRNRVPEQLHLLRYLDRKVIGHAKEVLLSRTHFETTRRDAEGIRRGVVSSNGARRAQQERDRGDPRADRSAPRGPLRGKVDPTLIEEKVALSTRERVTLEAERDGEQEIAALLDYAERELADDVIRGLCRSLRGAALRGEQGPHAGLPVLLRHSGSSRSKRRATESRLAQSDDTGTIPALTRIELVSPTGFEPVFQP